MKRFLLAQAKPSLRKILEKLGFQGLHDLITIVPSTSFEFIDDNLLYELVDEYRISAHILIPDVPVNKVYSDEIKLEIINRVLELKHGMIIDSVKEMDSSSDNLSIDGYRLELMPAGF